MKKTMWGGLSALPSYNGAKRRLLPWMVGCLSQVIPLAQWRSASWADACMGGGSVSLYLKALGIPKLQANDWSQRSTVVQQALLLNHSTHLRSEEVICLFDSNEVTSPGIVEQQLAGTVFSRHHARLLDRMLHNLATIQDPAKRELARLLLWHLVGRMVAFSTSIGSSNRPFAEILDGTGDWWKVNPKRFQDKSFGKLLKPILPQAQSLAEKVNQGVFAAAGKVMVSQSDAFDFVRTCTADCLYLDVPYPDTVDYERSTQVLDTVLFGTPPPEDRKISPFSKGTDALSDLLVQSRSIPMTVISYGNKVIDLAGLESLVRAALPEHTVHGFAKAYTHYAHVSKRPNNQELLVIAVDKNWKEHSHEV